MRRHRRSRAALFAILLCGLATLMPVSAGAGGGNFAARVDGSFADAAGDGTFDGTLTVSRFVQRGDRLVAVGTLDGTFTDGAGKALAELEEHPVALEVDGATLSASCELAKLVVTAGDVDSGGVKARLQPVEVEIAATAVPGHRLDGPLCELAKSLGPSTDLAAVAQQLDRVLAALE